jgi:hypothetical protein
VVRWVLLALIFLLAAGSVVWVRYRSPLYQSQVTVAFITKTTRFHGEVYDHFTDNHIYTAQAAMRLFDNPSTRKRIVDAGGTAYLDFELAHWGNQEVPVYGQPYATMRAVSRDPTSSINTLNIALEVLSERLEQWQTDAGATGRVMIAWEPIDAIRGPELQSLQIKRAMGGIAAIALIAAACVLSATRRRASPTPTVSHAAAEGAGRPQGPPHVL